MRYLRTMQPESARFLPPGLGAKDDPARAATLVDLCQMLINANEFVFVN